MALTNDEDNLATLAGFIGKDHPIVEADADDQVVDILLSPSSLDVSS